MLFVHLWFHWLVFECSHSHCWMLLLQYRIEASNSWSEMKILFYSNATVIIILYFVINVECWLFQPQMYSGFFFVVIRIKWDYMRWVNIFKAYNNTRSRALTFVDGFIISACYWKQYNKCVMFVCKFIWIGNQYYFTCE